MSGRARWSLGSWTSVATLAFLVAGCRHAGSVLPPAPTASPTASASGTPTTTPTATPAPQASLPASNAKTGGTLSTSGGTMNLDTNGINATLTYPAANAASAAQFSLAVPPASPSPEPSGNPAISFGVETGNSVAFSGPVYVSTITFPSGFSPAGQVFSEELYDTTAGTDLGNVANASGSASSQTVAFTAAAAAPNLTTTALDQYVLLVTYQAAAVGTTGHAMLDRTRNP